MAVNVRLSAAGKHAHLCMHLFRFRRLFFSVKNQKVKARKINSVPYSFLLIFNIVLVILQFNFRMPKATVVKKRKAANGYKLAEPLPLGEVLKDVSKKEWKLGPSIGQGGFGEIYSAKEAASKGLQYPYVIKIVSKT